LKFVRIAGASEYRALRSLAALPQAPRRLFCIGQPMKPFPFAVLIVLATAGIHAHSAPLCQGANATPESQKCMEAQIQKAEAQLSKYLEAAQAEADTLSSDPPRLGAAQKLWLQYREQQCGDAYLFWLAGTYRYEASLQCQLELTRSRTHEVWSTFLVRLGNSPPALPEP
jgi:uncharacterized protein YecT (DUF1311 family)